MHFSETISHCWHSIEDMLHPVRSTQERVRHAIEHGGVTHVYYMRIFREIIRGSCAADVADHIRHAVPELKIMSIETRLMHERWQIGLITYDDYLVRIRAKTPEGLKMEFGEFYDGKK